MSPRAGMFLESDCPWGTFVASAADFFGFSMLVECSILEAPKINRQPWPSCCRGAIPKSFQPSIHSGCKSLEERRGVLRRPPSSPPVHAGRPRREGDGCPTPPLRGRSSYGSRDVSDDPRQTHSHRRWVPSSHGPCCPFAAAFLIIGHSRSLRAFHPRIVGVGVSH